MTFINCYEFLSEDAGGQNNWMGWGKPYIKENSQNRKLSEINSRKSCSLLVAQNADVLGQKKDG